MGWSFSDALQSLSNGIADIPGIGDLWEGSIKTGGKVLDEVGGGLGIGDLERYGTRMRNSPREAGAEIGALAAALAGGYALMGPGGAAGAGGVGGGAASLNPYSVAYGTGVGNSGLYGLSAATSAEASAPFWASSAAGTSGAGLYGTEALAAGASGYDLAGASQLAGLDAGSLASLSGGSGFGAPSSFAPSSGFGGSIPMSPFDTGVNALKRTWNNPWGRMALMRAGTGLYARNRMRSLERRLSETDVTQTPGYRAGERAIARRAAAGGYGDSTRMLAELSDYGQQSYDRFAANERANYQARMGGLMSEMNTLGMMSLGLGF